MTINLNDFSYLGDDKAIKHYIFKLFGEILKPNNKFGEQNKIFGEQIILELESNNFVYPEFKKIFVYIKDYYNQYKSIPNIDNLNSIITNKESDPTEKDKLHGITKFIVDNLWKKYKSGEINNDTDYVKQEAFVFIKDQGYRNIAKEIEYKCQAVGGRLTEEDIDQFKLKFLKVSQIGDVNDYGTDLLDDVDSFIDEADTIKIPMGIPQLDAKLDGGIGNGELCLFLAYTGGGKSTVLTYIANNMYLNGKNVLHIVLEGTKNDIRKKHCAKITRIPIRDFKRRRDELKRKIDEFKKKPNLGNLIIKRFPDGTTSSKIINWTKRVEEVKGIKFDAIVIDYIDEVEPDIRTNNQWEGEHKVVKAFESMAVEMDTRVISALQAKKEAAGVRILDLSHTAGSASKGKKATLVIGIGKDKEQKESNKADWTIIKSRHSKDGTTFEDVYMDGDILEIRFPDESTKLDLKFNNHSNYPDGNMMSVNDIARMVENELINVKSSEKPLVEPPIEAKPDPIKNIVGETFKDDVSNELDKLGI